MPQPNDKLVSLALTKIEIRPTPDFVKELWEATHEAVFKTGEAIFVCHIQHHARLSRSAHQASTMLESFNNDSIFGYPVKFTREGQSLFYLIKQSGVDLNEPVIVTGEISTRWIEACERHPKARHFYLAEGPTLMPGSGVQLTP